jgi:two-component system, OmpR family, sensor histidine kinase TctE
LLPEPDTSDAIPGRVATAKRLLDMPWRSDAKPQRSLFGEILDWMLAPLLVLWPMSLGLTWVVAQGIASGPFDRALADVALALARQANQQAVSSAKNGPGQDDAISLTARVELQRTAEPLTRLTDDDDQVYYQVLGPRGELLAGDARLSVLSLPPPETGEPGVVRFRDDVVADEPVRVAYVWLARPSDSTRIVAGSSLVQVAETLGKRSRLATEIIKGVILPQFVILPVAVLLVWFALVRGIRPLAELQLRIRRRQSTDLSPIDEGNVPDEVAPLVRAINDLLQRLDRTVATQRHFLADAAHQLKTPLAGLRTQAELAARDIDSGRGDPASQRHSLLQIARSSERAAHMVNQLLAMARAEDTGQAMRRTAVDLAELTRDVVRDFVPQALDKQIDLGFELVNLQPDPESDDKANDVMKAPLLAEPVLLGELVRNLVDNALRYTPAGGSVTARVLYDSADRSVALQVEDTGPGIPPAEREAVFRPFYRALGTAVDGSGLGLAIVNEIAQRHGATITLSDGHNAGEGRDGAGPGALFTVRFALVDPT